jgi:hypothetical protein
MFPRDLWQLRTFTGKVRLICFQQSSINDDKLMTLVKMSIQHGDLVAIKPGQPVELSGPEKRSQELRRIARSIDNKTHGRLSDSGRQYQLVADEELSRMPNRDSYEVVQLVDAQKVLDALAKQPGTGPDLAELFKQARDYLTRDWERPYEADGLILMRRIFTPQAARSNNEPAITPSQLRALMEKVALEIHVVDQNKKPQEGVAFKIDMPDGGSVSGKLDKEGRGRAKSSLLGDFTVSFPDLDGADWDGDGALDLPDEERSEAGRCKATSEDRVPAIAVANGFVRWRTVWDFAGNANLKATRENPNVLRNGDEVAIPSKVQRVAEVEGGVAEYVVRRDDERIVTFRLLDCEHEPFAGLRYQSKTGSADINRGVVPEDGWVTLAIPSDADKVEITLCLSDDENDDPLVLEYQVQEEALGDSPEHKNQRLLNLGLTAQLPEGESGDESAGLALARYRSLAGNHEDEDGDVFDAAATLHDGGDSEGQA